MAFPVKTLGIVVVVVALTLQPILSPAYIWLTTQPYDDVIQTIPKLTLEELVPHYENKSALVIGGSRGIGYGIGQVLAKAGAHVTVVSRSKGSGMKAVDALKQVAVARHSGQQIRYFQGDLGTVKSTFEFVEELKKEQQVYDYLVVCAGVWPDWDNLTNEDGLEKSYAIMVVGRFLVYRNMHHFINPKGGRVLNVIASGAAMPFHLDRDMAMGITQPTNLVQALLNLCTALEISLVGLEERNQHELSQVVRVSTHPGLIATELHNGQPFLTNVMIRLSEFLMAISEEECGMRQLSILASDRLVPGKQLYVDNYGMGRKRSARLQQQVDEHLDWLWNTLLQLEQSHKSINNVADVTEDVAAKEGSTATEDVTGENQQATVTEDVTATEEAEATAPKEDSETPVPKEDTETPLPTEDFETTVPETEMQE